MQTLKVSRDWFQGAVSFEQGDDWLRPWRLPFERIGVYAPIEALAERAAMPAGVRLRLTTDATALALDVVPTDAPRPFDVCVDDELLRTAVADAGAERVDLGELPPGAKIVEVWLPHVHPVAIRGLALSDGAGVSPAPDERPRWLHYGSSISHCGSAHSPARTWPAIVARERGLHLTGFGFGGNCHLEPMVARCMAALPADYLSLKVGINIYGGATLSPRTFRPALIGFVQILRDAHPDVPLAVISPIWSPPRETVTNAVGFTLQSMRDEVRDAVARLQADGDARIWYVDGLELFGPDLGEHLPDELHPSGDGYEILAANYQTAVLDAAPVGVPGRR